MGSKLCPHWIPVHTGPEDAATFSAWKPKAIKIVSSGGVPPHLDMALAANPELLVIRDHALSEQKDGDPHLLGIAHAKAIKKISDRIKTLYPQADTSRMAFEGVNEPELWARNPPSWVIQYEEARLKVMHADGLRAVVGNLNVGWPGDYGLQDSPPNWEPFAPMFAAMNERDFLGLHEYWAVDGPSFNWLWWGGRYLQCPANVSILLTECGLDNAVTGGPHLGWHGLPYDMDNKAEIYAEQLLLTYANELRRDKRIYAAFIFTHDFGSADWQTFSTRDDVFLRHFLAALGRYQPPPVFGDNRTDRWKWLCAKYAEPKNLDPRVVATVLALESAGRVDAVSSAGAVGLMQVMPHEKIPGRPLAVLLKNPDLNVRWGTQILADGTRAFGGSLAHGLAAYYMGVGGVRAKGLQHPDAQKYLTTFARVWQELWPGQTLPGDVQEHIGETPPEPVPPLSVVRFFAEEAVREIEAMQAELAATRQRLLDNVIAPLYAHEGRP